jgi:hypothetical protein
MGIWTDGEPALGESDSSFDAAIYDEVLTALHFAVNDDALADARWGILLSHKIRPSVTRNRALPELYANWRHCFNGERGNGVDWHSLGGEPGVSDWNPTLNPGQAGGV